MTLMLELTQEEERQLRERAVQLGQDTPEYALGLLRQDISSIGAKHSIMELEGIGVDHRRDVQGDLVDAQEYINSLREEWDHRP